MTAATSTTTPTTNTSTAPAAKSKPKSEGKMHELTEVVATTDSEGKETKTYKKVGKVWVRADGKGGCLILKNPDGTEKVVPFSPARSFGKKHDA